MSIDRKTRASRVCVFCFVLGGGACMVRACDPKHCLLQSGYLQNLICSVDGFQSSSKRIMKHFIWSCLAATWRCAPAPAAKNEAAVRQAGQKLLCFGAAPALACGIACHGEWVGGVMALPLANSTRGGEARIYEYDWQTAKK